MAPKKRKRFSFTTEIVLDIYHRDRAGEDQHDIAADYGINQGRVSEIRNGLRFSHITGATPAS